LSDEIDAVLGKFVESPDKGASETNLSAAAPHRREKVISNP
jgi:hypothetical protein